MKMWQKVWREGIAPYLEHRALMALRKGAAEDDPRLQQGCTTTPPPLMAVQDWPCEGACPLGYAGWQGMEMKTVGEVEEFFARFCFQIDQRIAEPTACRYFLNWADETPRSEMLPLLVAEIDHELAVRERAGRGAA